jgi:hypothetical protein
MPSSATFTAVYTTILGPLCVSCHGTEVADMSFATKSKAYAGLVGVTAQGSACGRTGEIRVVPGSSATSLLYTKIAGTQTCGTRMPKGRPALSQTSINLIKSWIDEGAQNN